MFKQVSPLRYPGGKAQFYRNVVAIFKANNVDNSCTYIEPFAGGSGIALKLLMDGYVNRIMINDRDLAIYSFWYSILNNRDQFVQLIKDTPVTIEEWHRQKAIYSNPDSDTLSLGFATFFLNRTNRSGIILANPIGGINQTNEKYPLSCRFNKENLIERIDAIYVLRDKIVVSNMDAIDLIKTNNSIDDSFWFIDPPYYKRGKQLYSNYYVHDDHKRLADVIKAELKNVRWLLTYDVCEEIKKMYFELRPERIILRYSVQTKRISEELLFCNNLLAF